MLYCKKIICKDALTGEIYTLLGVVICDDGQFVHIRTSKRKYTINKSLVLRIDETLQEFRGYDR